MKERPILFSSPMVRALLAGRKTMTRRVLKPQPVFQHGGAVFDAAGGQEDYIEPHWLEEPKPSYAPGDLMWVRETFVNAEANGQPTGNVVYRADATDKSGMRWGSITPGDPEKEVRWKSPIHMPRWASRLTLRITSVKVERLQEISEADAIAEGIERAETAEYWRDYSRDPLTCESPRQSFETLWASIHGPGSWEDNPWVAACTFERIT
jgi:hypothetical protein